MSFSLAIAASRDPKERVSMMARASRINGLFISFAFLGASNTPTGLKIPEDNVGKNRI